MADDTQSPNPSARKSLTAERLREVLHYDPETGVFVWQICLSSRGPVGGVAGYRDKNLGRRIIGIDGKIHFAHRLAWLYVTGYWPDLQIDHADLNQDNNRFSNLREATGRQNMWNIGKPKHNTSGYKGVHFCQGKWRARICAGARYLHLGRFATPEQAYDAYCAAAKELRGKFARVE